MRMLLARAYRSCLPSCALFAVRGERVRWRSHWMSGRGDGETPLFLRATADEQHEQQAQLPVPDAGRQPQRHPHKKKAQGKKRKRARRALRLSLRPQIDEALPVLARLHEGHAATPGVRSPCRGEPIW